MALANLVPARSAGLRTGGVFGLADGLGPAKVIHVHNPGPGLH